MSAPSEDWTLAEVREWLRLRVNDGVDCPACGQTAKVYRRKINAGMAKALTVMYAHARRDWFYLPDISHRWQGRDEAGLRYWGLIEEATERRADGGRAGWWRITERGEEYVRNTTLVPKYARVYDGRVLGFDGEYLGIRSALGDRFNYDDLMAGV